MSWFRRSRSMRRNAAYALLALLFVAALGLAVAPSATGYPNRPGTSSVAGRLSPFGTVFGPNYRANSDNTQYGQHEPGLAVSRTNPNVVVVAQKDYRNGDEKNVWIESSTDGGVTWPIERQLEMPGVNPSQFPLMSDPVVMARDDGRIYVACLGYNNDNAVFITWTDDSGATWHTPSVQISPTDGNLDDKDWFAVDNTPTSPYFHNVYMMYSPGAGYVAEQHSTDGGLTWTPRQAIGQSNTEYTYPVVGHDGTVYNFMMLNWGGGQTGTIQLTKSTNGGANWSTPTTVSTAIQPPAFIPRTSGVRFFAILSAAVDPNNGALYVAWTDYRNSGTQGMDVVYVKSTDHGATWSSPVLLANTQARECSTCDNITPMVVVGADSRLHAFWLDRTYDINHNLFDSFYSSSTDGGATWEPDVRVSTVSQDLSIGLPPGSGGAAGDYWGLDTVGNTVYVAWNDTRSGNQDILVSRGTFGEQTGTPTPLPPSATPVAPTGTPVLPTSTQVLPTGTVPQASSTPAAPTQTPGGPTSTPAITPTVGEPTPCALSFTDVPSTDPFYVYIRCLACRGIVSGYSDGTFRPYNNITRGQISKVVSNAAGFSDPIPSDRQTYADVPGTDTFWEWIERLTVHGVMGGYQCGGVGEPCDPQSRPYFRPYANATRAQLAKIDSNAAGYIEPATGQYFSDVSPAHPFYVWIQRLASRGIMSGYPCGGAGEPCDPENRPYFRPYNDVTRGQASKIVANTFYPNCVTPAAVRPRR